MEEGKNREEIVSAFQLVMRRKISDYYKLSLEDIAKLNIKKLMSRKHRNKIRGSGDNR